MLANDWTIVSGKVGREWQELVVAQFEIILVAVISKNLKIKIYKSIILSVVLYGCETWSFTLREERRLKVFENGMLRRVFGAKRDEVTGELGKRHNE
jgi:hypothetical protein